MSAAGQLPERCSARRAWPKRIAYGLCGLILVALFVAALKQGRDWVELRKVIAELREQHEPVTFDELVAAYRQDAPEGDDLTERWLSNCAKIGVAMRDAQESNRSTDDLVQSLGAPLSQLHELATTPGFVRLPLKQDAETGLVSRQDTAEPEGDSEAMSLHARSADDLLAACQCLCLDAASQAEHGDGTQAVKSLCAGLALAHTLDHVPTTIGLLQRAGFRNRVFSQLKRSLAQGKFSTADLLLLQAELAKESDLSTDVLWAFRGDRVGGVAAFDIAWNRGDWLYKSWFYQADKLFFLRAVQELSDQFQLPYPEGSAAAAQSPLYEQASKHIIAESLLPAAAALYAAYTRDLAAGRVALIAVALTRYQLDHDRPPEKLADLVPAYLSELPTDPLFGDPFHYEVNSAGYSIFSPWKSFSEETRDAQTGFDTTVLYRWPEQQSEEKPIERAQEHLE